MDSEYFIKKGYIENKPIANSSKKDYIWNDKRIKRNLNANYYVYEYASKVAKSNNIKTVLDIGCGVGVKLYHFFIKDNYYVTAVDNLQAVRYCKANYKNALFWVSDLSDKENLINLSDKKYDLIICVDVIEHFEKPELLLEFIKINAREESIIVISTPERDNVRGRNNFRSPNKDHIREWNKNEFELFLEHNGFEIIEHVLTKPIKCDFSLYYLRNFMYYKLRFKRFNGTQVVKMKIV